MKAKNGKRILTLILIIIGVACFLPAIFGEAPQFEDRTGGDAWRNVIYDFQTLIAGFVAIMAAVFTIIHGQELDDRQHRRHIQVIKLDLRRELNALKTFISEFEDNVMDAVSELDYSRSSSGSYTSEDFIRAFQHVSQHEITIGAINEFYVGNAYRAGEPYMPIDFVSAVKDLVDGMNDLLAFHETILEKVLRDGDGPVFAITYEYKVRKISWMSQLVIERFNAMKAEIAELSTI